MQSGAAVGGATLSPDGFEGWWTMKPKQNEIQWKVWLQEQADKAGVKVSAITNRMARGTMKYPKRRVVNARLIFVEVES